MKKKRSPSSKRSANFDRPLEKKNRRALEWPLKHTLTSDVRRKMTLKMAWSRRFWISGEMLGKNWEVGFHVYLILTRPKKSSLWECFYYRKLVYYTQFCLPYPNERIDYTGGAVIRVEIYNRGKEVDKWRHKTVYSSVFIHWCIISSEFRLIHNSMNVDCST